MQSAAAAASAFSLARVEGLEQRRQVGHYVLDVHFDATQQRVAISAIPLEAIGPLGWPHFLDPQADRSGGALRGMADVAGNQQDFALPDRHLARAAPLDDSEHDVAAQLVEEFLVWIVVIVGARVRAADDLH